MGLRLAGGRAVPGGGLCPGCPKGIICASGRSYFGLMRQIDEHCGLVEFLTIRCWCRFDIGGQVKLPVLMPVARGSGTGEFDNCLGGNR